MYAPVLVNTKGKTGGAVSLEILTDYPFDWHVTININSDEKQLPVHFRVPSWAVNATFSQDGGSPKAATSGGYFTVMVTEPSTKIEAMFPMRFNVTRRYNNSAAIYYGLVVNNRIKICDWILENSPETHKIITSNLSNLKYDWLNNLMYLLGTH